MMQQYIVLFEGPALQRNNEPEFCKSNYWFNSVSFKTPAQCNALIIRFPFYTSALCGLLDNPDWLDARIVNLLSSVAFPKKVFE